MTRSVIDSQEVSSGIVLDFNDRSQVVGIEILDLKKRFPNADPRPSAWRCPASPLP